MLLPHQMMPQRFDPKTGTMIPDPTADTAAEIRKMLAFQASHGALTAQRMPPDRKKQRAREKLAAERSRSVLTGQRPLAEIQAGRKRREDAAREARLLELERADTDADALEAAELEAAELRARLAELEARSSKPAPALALETRDMVSALLDNALEKQRAEKSEAVTPAMLEGFLARVDAMIDAKIGKLTQPTTDEHAALGAVAAAQPEKTLPHASSSSHHTKKK
jgi:hypothetical protein